MFNICADYIDRLVSHPVTFVAFLIGCVIGPFFTVDWSNYAISVITASLLFLGNGSKRRKEIAGQVKLDAILKATDNVPNTLARIEDLAEDEIEQARREC